jgi:hypothetical protein
MIEAARYVIVIVTPNYIASPEHRRQLTLLAKQPGIKIRWIHAESSTVKFHEIRNYPCLNTPDHTLGQFEANDIHDEMSRILAVILDELRLFSLMPQGKAMNGV